MAKPPKQLDPDHYRWYRRDPSRALAGMRELNIEQRGVYCTLIELVYEARGPISDDDVSRAHDCKCDIRRYRRIKSELVRLDRIVVHDGYLYDERAVRELVSKRVFSEKQAKRARQPRPARRTRNKVVRLVVHEGGDSPDGARTDAGTVQPKSPPAPLKSKAKTLAIRKDQNLSLKAGEKAQREPSNIGPVEPRALEEQQRLLREFIAKEEAREQSADRKATRT